MRAGKHFSIILLIVLLLNVGSQGVKAIGLYPKESESREVKSLDGIWNFVKSDSENQLQGVDEKWYTTDLNNVRPTIQMPVPSSYNDITQDITLRDHVGTVWYDRKFFVPCSWRKSDRKVFIRFESVHYAAVVWINGEETVKHEFGHLPFEAEITHLVKYGKENRVTVLCDNILLENTIPQGTVGVEQVDNGTRIQQSYTFDFFNYAGIHRSVYLYTVPDQSIEDIIIKTNVDGTDGIVDYDIKLNTNLIEDKCLYIEIRGKNDTIVATSATTPSVLNGTVKIKNVQLWWPYLMDPNYGYLYTLTFILGNLTHPIDYYRLRIGVRTLFWDNNQFLINNKPIYFHGFGKHEDSDIRGKGADNALLVRDFNLLKWSGANVFRTSHYPYSSETMDMADENGIMIIDECAAVNVDKVSEALLQNHQLNLKTLINRDKNHPSVVMWSVANEPRSRPEATEAYFREIVNFVRNEDPSRPITAAINVDVLQDHLGQFLDIIGFNRYNGWYANSGKLDMITQRVIDEATAWRQEHNKPVIMLEYGADTLEGLHLSPPYIWSEEFQNELFSQHFKAFDFLRSQGFFIGEFVWNFADFKTAQTTTRVGGNKKGVFTRNRQPKSVAHLLRQRYNLQSYYLYQTELPTDLFLYVISGNYTAQTARN